MTQYVLSAGEIVLRLPQGLTWRLAGHDPCGVTLVKTGGDLDRPCTLYDPARELFMTQGH